MLREAAAWEANRPTTEKIVMAISLRSKGHKDRLGPESTLMKWRSYHDPILIRGWIRPPNTCLFCGMGSFSLPPPQQPETSLTFLPLQCPTYKQRDSHFPPQGGDGAWSNSVAFSTTKPPGLYFSMNKAGQLRLSKGSEGDLGSWTWNINYFYLHSRQIYRKRGC